MGSEKKNVGVYVSTDEWPISRNEPVICVTITDDRRTFLDETIDASENV